MVPLEYVMAGGLGSRRLMVASFAAGRACGGFSSPALAPVKKKDCDPGTFCQLVGA